MEFNTYLTRFEGSGVVFMKSCEGEQGREHKENKCGSDYLGVFGACALELCVCIANILYSSEVTVLEISVMVGTLPLGLLQKWSIPDPTESRLNLHFICPCP